MEDFKISAPGKLILCGEHAVVYGKKALASAIGLRTHLTAKKIHSQFFEIHLKNNLSFVSYNKTKFDSIKEIYKNKSNDEIIVQMSDLGMENKSIIAIMFMISSLGDSLIWDNLMGTNVEIFSEIPLGSGLGSSAAFAVCLSTFFLIKAGIIKMNDSYSLTNENRNIINEYAYFIEKIFHGRPSGIDNTVSTNGNYIIFEKGKFECVSSEIDLPVLVIDSCVPKRTIEQVAKVRKYYEKYTSFYEPLMNIIDGLVEKFANIIQDKSSDKSELYDLITINHGLLHSMQVSNSELSRIVSIAQSHGVSCKITGAGGGGCCYAILNNENFNEIQLENFVKDLEKHQFTSFKAMLGVKGVHVEKN